MTVFIAVLAFFPKEERRLLEFKLGKIEYWSILIILVMIIPYLILFMKSSLYTIIHLRKKNFMEAKKK